MSNRRGQHVGRGIGRLNVTALLAISGISGCADLFGPAFPDSARRFEPPAVYSNWWAVVERCAVANGRLDEVRWFTVPATTKLRSQGRHVDGVVYPDGRIVLREQMVLEGSLVRHEMLHVLSGHTSTHPAELFQGRCGDLVACESGCRTDGGAWRPDTLGAQIVDERELTLHGQSTPSRLSLRKGPLLLSVVAEVRNPRTTPVRVPLRASDGGYLEKFGVQLRSLSTGEVLVGRSEIAATDALAVSSRGVRRALLDFDLTSLAGEIGPENLEVIVTFGRAAAAVDTVEVSP